MSTKGSSTVVAFVDAAVSKTGGLVALMPTLGGSAGSGCDDGDVTSVAWVAAEFQAVRFKALAGMVTRTDTAKLDPLG